MNLLQRAVFFIASAIVLVFAAFAGVALLAVAAVVILVLGTFWYFKIRKFKKILEEEMKMAEEQFNAQNSDFAESQIDSARTIEGEFRREDS